MIPGLTGTNRSNTLLELICGILLYGVVGQLLVLCFFHDKVSMSMGWWIGVTTAVLSAYHMWWGLDRALDLNKKDAAKSIALHNLLRYGAMVIIMGIVIITETGNPLTAVFGMYGLKMGAYMQPFIYKLNQYRVQSEYGTYDNPYKGTEEEVPEEKEVNV